MVDWDGDGVYSDFDVLMDLDYLDFCDREERINKMLDAIFRHGYTHVDYPLFEQLCREIGIPIEKYEQEDIDEIQRRGDKRLRS